LFNLAILQKKVFLKFGSNIVASWPPTIKQVVHILSALFLLIFENTALFLADTILEIIQKQWECQEKNNKKRI
jgi:hypothetical protein